jgi:uncharacterized protein with von Willebrand factor type A (vWA) domain
MSEATWLLPNLLLFARVLRAAGLDVRHDRVADTVRALPWIGVRSRSDVRAALRALLVHRQDDLALFDAAFDLFFRAPASSHPALPVFSRGERPGGVTGAWPRTARVDFDDVSAAVSRSAALAAGAYSPVEVSRTKDFAEFTAAELERARILLARLPWHLGARRTRRWERASGGSIDLRPLCRKNLMRGDVVELPRRRRRAAPRPIVLIGDVSGSMSRYSRMLLAFAYGLAQNAGRVESFLFATRLTRVTRRLATRRGEAAIAALTRDLHDWGGGTRIGEALRTFNTRWARRVMRNGPVVLIVSDGWDRGDPALLAREIARVRRGSRRLIWLNPLLGSAGYEPLTRGMQSALAHVDDFLPAHNLASLEQLAGHLRTLLPGSPGWRMHR